MTEKEDNRIAMISFLTHMLGSVPPLPPHADVHPRGRPPHGVQLHRLPTVSPSPIDSQSPLNSLIFVSYWSEQRDAGAFRSSVLLDPVYGFGGDGVPPSGCIADGPFANYTNPLGPGYQVTNHCINRAINDQISTGSAKGEVDACVAMGVFEQAWPCIEARPHTGGHLGVGGEVSLCLLQVLGRRDVEALGERADD